eukprot:298079-Rhodomonas_salina.1
MSVPGIAQHPLAAYRIAVLDVAQDISILDEHSVGWYQSCYAGLQGLSSPLLAPYNSSVPDLE